MPRRAFIAATAHHLPDHRLSNDLLAEQFPDWPADKILEKTGIAERRVAAPDETSGDLAARAAEKLFATGVCAPGEIDFLLFCTQSPDYFLPTTACLLQHRLGVPTTAGALDYNLGCSGFVYGLSMAKGLIETGQAQRVLLLTGETYSKFIHPEDKSVRTLFGDAGSATLVDSVETDESPFLGPFVFGTDGAGAENLIVPTGGLRGARTAETAVETTDAQGNTRSGDNLRMNGPEIFTFTLKSVPKSVEAVLARAELGPDEVDWYVFHQANAYMLEHLRKKIKIPTERFVLAMRDCGNTVSSTIPIALEATATEGALKAGQRVMIVGFGVGYSWAAGMIRWR